MKKTIIVIAGIVVLLVAVLLLLNKFGNKMDRQSKKYVDDLIPDVTSDWDAELFIKEASNELLEIVNEEDIKKLFRMFKLRLGELKEYKGSEGQSLISLSPRGAVITAYYLGKAQYEKGEATIQVRVIKRNKKWEVLRFHVNSDAFLT